MTPITPLSPIGQADQLNATTPRANHSHGAHYVMTEGNTATSGPGNAGAVQSFAAILGNVMGVAKNFLV